LTAPLLAVLSEKKIIGSMSGIEPEIHRKGDLPIFKLENDATIFKN